jgi:predicted phage terminase large subunit-like protein
MFFAPPGSAKTTYVSRLSVPWILQRHPRWSIIGASHSSLLSNENSSYAIRYANEYAGLLGYKLESENVQRWRTSNGGDYLAASVEGGIAGFRADLAIVDDPIRMRKDADSETFQNSLWRWWTADLERRLKPEGHIILMHTRWNLRDLAGMLLKTDAARWKVIVLPALATSHDDPLGRAIGEPLWDDDDYSYGSKLFGIRDDLHKAGAAMDWASLFQQDPRPNDGALFKIDKLAANIIDEPPSNISWVRGWDLAATKDLGTLNAAFTAGVKLGRTPDNKFVIGNVRRERLEPEGVEDLIVGTAKRDGYSCKVGIPQDPGQAGKFQVQYLVTKLAGYSVEFSPETGDKATRAAPFASQVNVGNVAMIKGDWNDAFLEEARAFPVGATLDQIDASSRAFSMIFRGGAALWAAIGKA